jgi:hypothetical protein
MSALTRHPSIKRAWIRRAAAVLVTAIGLSALPAASTPAEARVWVGVPGFYPAPVYYPYYARPWYPHYYRHYWRPAYYRHWGWRHHYWRHHRHW